MDQQIRITVEKSRSFAIRIIKLYKQLCAEQEETNSVQQLLRSGTSVDTNVREALSHHSRTEFTAKMNLALQEIAETENWLDALHASNHISDDEFFSLSKDCENLIKHLFAIITGSKRGRDQESEKKEVE